jgi:nucleoid-associated protein YgaU
MWKRVLSGAVLSGIVCSAAVAAADPSKALVGKYQMDVADGDVLELRPDGTASLAGDEMRWSAQGNVLTVGTDVMPYQLTPSGLVLSMGSVQIAWKRLGGTASKAPASAPKDARAPAADADDREALAQAQAYLAQQQRGAPKAPQTPAAPRPAAPTAGAASPQDAQARQVLQSTAWCSFTFNKVSGTSKTTRVVFRPDGVLTSNGDTQTYNSGPAGSYAGQSNTAGAMRWKLENLRLYIDPGDGSGFQDIGLTAELNSSGSPILHALGREYMVCQ